MSNTARFLCIASQLIYLNLLFSLVLYHDFTDHCRIETDPLHSDERCPILDAIHCQFSYNCRFFHYWITTSTVLNLNSTSYIHRCFVNTFYTRTPAFFSEWIIWILPESGYIRRLILQRNSLVSTISVLPSDAYFN